MRQVVAAALLLLCASASRADDLPFVYDRAGGLPGWRVEAETAVGTRDTRPIGARGVEQAISLEHGIGRLTLDARAGMLLGDGAVGGSVEASVLLGGGLTIGGGAGVDYRGDRLLRASASLRGAWGRLALGANALAEKPFADDRDSFDVVLGAGGSWQMARGWRAGAELLGEDLEGFWNADEAEGGARLLAGPTLAVDLGGFDLTMNAAAVVVQRADTGFMGRLLLGRSF